MNCLSPLRRQFLTWFFTLTLMGNLPIYLFSPPLIFSLSLSSMFYTPRWYWISAKCHCFKMCHVSKWWAWFIQYCSNYYAHFIFRILWMENNDSFPFIHQPWPPNWSDTLHGHSAISIWHENNILYEFMIELIISK